MRRSVLRFVVAVLCVPLFTGSAEEAWAGFKFVRSCGSGKRVRGSGSRVKVHYQYVNGTLVNRGTRPPQRPGLDGLSLLFQAARAAHEPIDSVEPRVESRKERKLRLRRERQAAPPAQAHPASQFVGSLVFSVYVGAVPVAPAGPAAPTSPSEGPRK
jgi:hypothetical protein